MKFDNQIDIVKGVHPGVILERELRKRNLPKGRFAIAINEFPQTIGAITKGKRAMNTSLALRIEKELGFDEGYFMILQVFYEIEIEKRKSQPSNLSVPNVRPVLFWDTKPASIDWQKQKRAIIERVYERGNEFEKSEMIRYYGKSEVEKTLNKS